MSDIGNPKIRYASCLCGEIVRLRLEDVTMRQERSSVEWAGNCPTCRRDLGMWVRVVPEKG